MYSKYLLEEYGIEGIVEPGNVLGSIPCCIGPVDPILPFVGWPLPLPWPIDVGCIGWIIGSTVPVSGTLPLEVIASHKWNDDMN